MKDEHPIPEPENPSSAHEPLRAITDVLEEHRHLCEENDNDPGQ